MTEFIQKELLPFLGYFQIVTALIITVFSYKLKTPILKAYVFIFWYAALNEFFGNWYIKFIDTESNYIIYNIFFVINFSYLFYLYHYFIKNKSFKFIIICFVIIYFTSITAELFILKKNYFIDSQSLSYIIAATGILISILFYFFEVLISDEIIEINRKPLFWISIAVFFYFIALLPFKIGQGFYTGINEYKHLFSIRILMTLLMNIILIIGFIWIEKEEN